MHIAVTRTGGFAGLTENVAAVDTEQLDPVAREQVEQLVQGLGFFELPVAIAGGTIGADLFHYEITVSEGERQHTVAFVEDDSPETASLRRLIAAVTQMR